MEATITEEYEQATGPVSAHISFRKHTAREFAAADDSPPSVLAKDNTDMVQSGAGLPLSAPDEATFSDAPLVMEVLDNVNSSPLMTGQPSMVGVAPTAASSGAPAAVCSVVSSSSASMPSPASTVSSTVSTAPNSLIVGEDGAIYTTRSCKACNMCADNRLKCIMLSTGKCTQCTSRGIECKHRLVKMRRVRQRVTGDNVAELVRRRKLSQERALSAEAMGVKPPLGAIPSVHAKATVLEPPLGPIPSGSFTGNYSVDAFHKSTILGNQAPSLLHEAALQAAMLGNQAPSLLHEAAFTQPTFTRQPSNLHEAAMQAAFIAGLQDGAQLVLARIPQMSYGSCYPQHCHPALATLPFQQLLHLAQPLGAGGMPALRAAFQQQATATQLGYGYVTPAVPNAALMPDISAVVSTVAVGTASTGAVAAGASAAGAAAAGAAAAGTSYPGLLGVAQRELRPPQRPTLEVGPGDGHQGVTGSVPDMSFLAPLGPLPGMHAGALPDEIRWASASVRCGALVASSPSAPLSNLGVAVMGTAPVAELPIVVSVAAPPPPSPPAPSPPSPPPLLSPAPSRCTTTNACERGASVTAAAPHATTPATTPGGGEIMGEID